MTLRSTLKVNRLDLALSLSKFRLRNSHHADLLYFTPPQPFHPTTNVNNPKNGKTPRKEHQAKVVVQKLGHHVYVKEQQLLYAAPPLHCSSEEEDDDLSDVDFVLISSHQHALALPYLTEHTNFCGRILITEPCAHLARYVTKPIRVCYVVENAVTHAFSRLRDALSH